MKKLIYILLLVITTTTGYSQVFLNVTTDPKVLIIGTDNQYTKHSPRFNYEIKLEYIWDLNSYLALGHKYVNLDSSFNNYYINLGQTILTRIDRLILVPQLETGFIVRELIPVDEYDNRHNPGALYVGVNLQVRYNLNERFFATMQGYVATAGDIDKLLRYGGTIGVSMKLFEPNSGFR